MACQAMRRLASYSAMGLLTLPEISWLQFVSASLANVSNVALAAFKNYGYIWPVSKFYSCMTFDSSDFQMEISLLLQERGIELRGTGNENPWWACLKARPSKAQNA